jgi:class 3 adenylate cyclase
MQYRSKILILLLFSICVSLANAREDGSAKLDSLFRILNATNNETTKIDILNKITTEYWEFNLLDMKDSMKYYLNQSIRLSRKIKYKKGLALALFNLGRYHISATNNYAEATPSFLESLDIYDELKDKNGISKCYLQLGLISYILQYFEDAVRNFKQSIANRENPTAKYLMALSYSEIDSFYSARKYFAMVIKEYEDTKNESMLGSSYMYLGKLFSNSGNLDSAFYYLNKSINHTKFNGTFERLIRPYAFISSVYLKNNEISKAIQYAEMSYNISLKSYDMISVIEASKTLSQAYKIKGDFRKAFFFLNLLYTKQELFLKGSTQQKVAEIKSTFEFRRRQQTDSLSNEKEKIQRELDFKDTLHEKNNERNIFLISAVGILLLAGGLWSRLRYTRKTASIIRKEKDRSEELLLNILPMEVAEELKTKGSAEAKLFDNVTVMFTDFVNFTYAVENLTPKDLIKELHTCFKEFDIIAHKYNIEKIKTSGDAYLAVCGLPAADSDHAVKMVRAAVEINEFMQNRLNKLGERTFNIRIGINTGSVIAGIVGVKKFAYDIWGDTVNIACRMEQSSESGKINISGSTYELVKDIFECTYRGKIEAKNKGEIDMYFINQSK